MVHGAWEETYDATEKLTSVVEAGKKTLREELEDQYDIDHARVFSTSGSAEQEGKRRKAAEEFLIWYDDDPMGSRSAAAEAGAAEGSKDDVVEAEFQRWLSRPASTDLHNTTMLDFWSAQPDCMLRRVAMRAGAFMLSQCATERINKLPKEIWSPKRMSLTSASVIRQVFLSANMDRMPPLEYNLEESKESK